MTTIRAIQNAVADEFGMTHKHLTGSTRSRTHTIPRHISMFLASEITGKSTVQIGLAFGDRDHTTVMNGLKRAVEILESSRSARVKTLHALRKLQRQKDAESAKQRRVQKAVERLESFREAAQ